MSCAIKYLTCSWLFLISCHSLYAQKIWPSAFDYKLQGNIKTWIMKDEHGNVIREEHFKDKEEQLNFQEMQAVPAKYKRFQPMMKKAEFEKIYSFADTIADSTVKMKFNERMQLIEKQYGNIHEWNKFGADGQILTHITTETFSQTIVGGGVKARNPKKAMADYVFSDTKSSILIFKYDHSGVIQEFESYDSDPSKNVRIVYVYDECGNLTERDQYDSSNISWTWHPEDYLEKFIHKDINSTFFIDQYYENYWCTGTPLKETWKYDSRDRKKEYVLYSGYQHSPSFLVKWRYNKDGWMEEESQFDVYQSIELYFILFDKYGNVIAETEFSNWDGKDRMYFYSIEYY